MHLVLKIGAAFLAFLIVFGGTVFPTRIGKIEVGSVDPWAWAFGLVLLAAYAFQRPAFDHFVSRAEQILHQLLDPKHALRRASTLIAAVFTLVFLAHLVRYWSFDTHFYDMGFVHQSLFYPFSDGILLQADLSPKRSYLVDHFSPTLLLLAPLTSWLHSNVMIFAIQQLLLGLGTFLLVSRGPLRKLPSLLLVAAFVALANRSLRNGGLWDFREDALAFCFLSGTIVTLYSRKITAYFVLLALYVLSKEHLGVVALGLTIPILLDRDLPYARRERWILSGATATLLLAWSAAVFGYITPTLQAGISETNNITMRFGQFGDSPKAIIWTVLTSPSAWWILIKTKLLTALAWKYVVLMLLPYLYFARFSWSWIAAAAIGLASNMASDSTLQRSLNFHYDLAFLPFLITGVTAGIKRRFGSSFGLGAEPSSRPVWNRQLLLGLFLALCFSGRWPAFHIWRNFPSVGNIRDHFFLENLPCPATIASNSRILARLVHCRELRSLDLPGVCEDPLKAVQVVPDDTSRLPGQSGKNASEFVLDTERSCEAALARELHAQPEVQVTASPTGRFLYLRLPRSWSETFPEQR